MIARSSAVVAAGGVLRTVRSGPPLTIRQVRSEDPSVCALCLVGTAAGPLAGDRVEFDVRVEAGARALVGSAGATLAQGRGRLGSAVLGTHADVGPGASLVSRCEPLVVCAGSTVDVQVRIELAATAALVWRELLVLGRAGETPGAVSLDWDVRRAGRPLLRQRTDLTAAAPWAGLLRGHRVLASELHVGPGLGAEPVVRSTTSVAQVIGDQAVLMTVLAGDAAGALAELATLRRLAAAGGVAAPSTDLARMAGE